MTDLIGENESQCEIIEEPVRNCRVVAVYHRSGNRYQVGTLRTRWWAETICDRAQEGLTAEERVDLHYEVEEV